MSRIMRISFKEIFFNKEGYRAHPEYNQAYWKKDRFEIYLSYIPTNVMKTNYVRYIDFVIKENHNKKYSGDGL